MIDPAKTVLDALLAPNPTAKKWTNKQRFIAERKQMLAVNLAESLATVTRAALEVDAAYSEGGTVDGDRIRAAHASMDGALTGFRMAAQGALCWFGGRERKRR